MLASCYEFLVLIYAISSTVLYDEKNRYLFKSVIN
jgi:hypothetical protein